MDKKVQIFALFMPIIFSRSCEYGIQAILFLAKQEKKHAPIQLKEISGALNLPHHFLSKIMQTLSHYGLVTSHKGVNGGYTLTKSPSHIRLMDIVRALDGDAFLDQCILGLPSCDSENPCAAHQTWLQAKATILDLLCMKTISDCIAGFEGPSGVHASIP